MTDLFSDQKFVEWLHELTTLGCEVSITISKDHKDVIDYYFKVGKTAEEALDDYKNNFLPRWNALTKGK